jgi:uncharacterized protein
MITKEIEDFFEKTKVMVLATVDSKKIPNVVPIGSKKIIDKKTIWSIDTFHQKTLNNIEQNPNVALSMWQIGENTKEGYQIKGKATYHTCGEIFEKARKWILKTKPNKIVKGVLEITVTDIFYLHPSYELAGKKYPLDT